MKKLLIELFWRWFVPLTLMVILTQIVIVLWVSVGIINLDDGPDGYYTYHPQRGYIIGMNDSRGVFYVETNKSIRTVNVEPHEFSWYEIGDLYEWEIAVYHQYQRSTNMTMIHSW